MTNDSVFTARQQRVSATLALQGPLDDFASQMIVQVPQNFEPFIIRLEVNDMERADLVMIDSIIYEGQLCELARKLALWKNCFFVFLQVPDETSSAPSSTQTIVEREPSEREPSDQEPMSDLPNQCKAVECDFNDGDACLYNTEGLGGRCEFFLCIHCRGGHLGGYRGYIMYLAARG
jgi:hypothetical protein